MDLDMPFTLGYGSLVGPVSLQQGGCTKTPRVLSLRAPDWQSCPGFRKQSEHRPHLQRSHGSCPQMTTEGDLCNIRHGEIGYSRIWKYVAGIPVSPSFLCHVLKSHCSQWSKLLSANTIMMSSEFAVVMAAALSCVRPPPGKSYSLPVATLSNKPLPRNKMRSDPQ